MSKVAAYVALWLSAVAIVALLVYVIPPLNQFGERVDATLDSLRLEVRLLREHTNRQDSLLWNYFTFSSFHLPDTIYCFGQVIDCTRP